MFIFYSSSYISELLFDIYFWYNSLMNRFLPSFSLIYSLLIIVSGITILSFAMFSFTFRMFLGFQFQYNFHLSIPLDNSSDNDWKVILKSWIQQLVFHCHIILLDYKIINEPTWRCHQNPFIGALGISSGKDLQSDSKKNLGIGK